MEYIETLSSVMKAGDKVGRYTVHGIYKKPNAYPKYAKVSCECGSDTRFVLVAVLRRGEAQSCGCLHKERVTKHGMWNQPLFNVWRAMHDRCYNQKNKRYQRYGARGITVCDRWHSLENFVADMSHSYKAGLTLDRIDNNRPYSPDNCRWATRSEQNRNYSRNVVFTWNGETLCLMEWAEKLGLNYGTLWDRIFVQKLNFEDAARIRT